MATWTRDELILTLDLYISSGHRVVEKTRPETIQLTAQLNRIRAADPEVPKGDVRTPGSVKAKLANFRALDPTTDSTGWGNGGRLDREVWDEFAGDPEALAHQVSLIRSSLNRNPS